MLERLRGQPAERDGAGFVAAADDAVVLGVGQVAETKVGNLDVEVLTNLRRKNTKFITVFQRIRMYNGYYVMCVCEQK